MTKFTRRQTMLGLAGTAAALATGVGASRQSLAATLPPATVRLGLFARTLPILVGPVQGFYAQENLDVQYLQVSGSKQQFEFLRDGKYDVISTSHDNVVTYRLNTSNPLGTLMDCKVFLSTVYGLNLSLMAKPVYTSLNDLRGKVLAVDSPISGFAFVLYHMLRQAGLERERDYKLLAVGGTSTRYAKLIAGEFDGTLLTYGFELQAAARGFRNVQSVQKLIDPYYIEAFAARTDWLNQNEGVAVRLCRAYQKTAAWTLGPRNREEALRILMGQPDTTRALAEQIYAVQTTPGVGFVPDGKTDQHAMYNMLKLREDFGGFDRPQNIRTLATPAGDIYTNKYAQTGG
jgi:ABC-type nitrate/sulfonate/bicarbonate transport system substrate-binding protein